jgi:hypothetical protein
MPLSCHEPAHYDLVLVSVPYTETESPLPALGVLKSVANSANWSCHVIDFNIDCVNLIEKSYYSDKFVDFFYNENYYPQISSKLLEMFDAVSDQILAHSPKLIGLSLFSYACQVAAKYLCIELRRKSPNTKIIIGGSGIFDNVLGDHSYVNNLLEMNLIDHYIVGDAEKSFYNFLIDSHDKAGVNNTDWKELSNTELEQLPFPDYSDYEFFKYKIPAIPVTGSRGCVRSCDFCNDIVHWKKFSFRSGKNIFDEMMHQMNRHGLTDFIFSDALINGNMKEFKILIELLAEYNTANPHNKLSWDSQFIFRPKNQFPEELWKTLALANPSILRVGIESLSENIRFQMGKKFDQDSLNFGLEMALKYNVNINGMMIVGYPTETETDIEYAKQWLKQYNHFSKILKLSWGGTMAILPGTKLDQNKDKLNIKVHGPPWQNWVNTVTGSNPSQRAKWLVDLSNYSKLLGFNNSSGIENQSIVSMMLTDN